MFLLDRLDRRPNERIDARVRFAVSDAAYQRASIGGAGIREFSAP